MRRKRTTSKRAIRDAERAALRAAFEADIAPLRDALVRRAVEDNFRALLGRVLTPGLSLARQPGVKMNVVREDSADE